MTTGQRTCSHEFPLPNYEDTPGDPSDSGYLLGPNDLGVEDGIWTCPHDAVAGKSKCVFHLEPADRPADCNITREFIEQIASANRREKVRARKRHRQFIDAIFDTFTPESTVIGGHEKGYIDCRHASFHEVNCEHTEFDQRIRFAQATFGHPNTDEAVNNQESPTKGLEVCFRRAIFRYSADFSDATFITQSNFRGAHFHDWAGFRFTHFQEDADFGWATFHDMASARGVEFDAKASFRAVGFEDYTQFVGAQFGDGVNFRLARFDDDADFPEAQFAGANFREAEFERTFDISEATITEPLRLDYITIIKKLDATSVQLEAPVRLDEAALGEVSVSINLGDSLADTAYLRFFETTISAGSFEQPTDGIAVYDFSSATIGDVRFHCQSDEPLYNRIIFHRTRFDGFDFSDSDDLNTEAVNHVIHEISETAKTAVPEEFIHNKSPEDLWATYLYAKNGADATGDNVSAGAFFYKEMVYRRHAHWERMLTDDSRSLKNRVLDCTKGVRNLVLSAVTGYGEKPDRVVYTSLIVILAFTPLYWLTAASNNGDTSFWEYLALSLQTFVSFILGSPPDSFTLWGEIISATEAFIGAFLVALFVFTLTRRVNR